MQRLPSWRQPVPRSHDWDNAFTAKSTKGAVDHSPSFAGAQSFLRRKFSRDLDELEMLVKGALQCVKDTDIHENIEPVVVQSAAEFVRNAPPTLRRPDRGRRQPAAGCVERTGHAAGAVSAGDNL